MSSPPSVQLFRTELNCAFTAVFPIENDDSNVIGVIFFSNLLNKPIKFEKNNDYCIEYVKVFFFDKSEKIEPFQVSD